MYLCQVSRESFLIYRFRFIPFLSLEQLPPLLSGCLQRRILGRLVVIREHKNGMRVNDQLFTSIRVSWDLALRKVNICGFSILCITQSGRKAPENKRSFQEAGRCPGAARKPSGSQGARVVREATPHRAGGQLVPWCHTSLASGICRSFLRRAGFM